MKNISSTLASHLASEVTTLANCWKIRCRDNAVLGFTDHDQDLSIDSVIYKASTGITPSAVSDNASLNVDNIDLAGILSSAAITEEDILAGKYDFAEIEIFKANYADLSQGILKLRKGWIGEVSLQGSHFTAEVRGLTQLLAQTIGELFSPSCRATLGDSRCKIDMALHTFTGAISSVIDLARFNDNARTESSSYFTSGIITFTSGKNAGISRMVKEYIYSSTVGGNFILALPMPYPIHVGDAYNISQGCDKTLSTCQQKFSNVINYRGEPHIPGLDRILETAGTKSSW